MPYDRPSRRHLLQGVAALSVGAVFASRLVSPPLAQAAPAPALATLDMFGKKVALADFKGKMVVLEWTNYGCPFVRKHYDSGAMQALQAEATAQGVIWLTIASSAEGQQGYVTQQAAQERTAQEKWSGSAFLLDPKGEIARTYEAKVTPHMFVIGTDGGIAYNGAIDDRPTSKKEDVVGATNYVRAALADLRAGRPVAVANSKPYGCGIKFGKTAA
jgi:glutathione peroxidase-family protein